ncbi:acyl-CoA dehydrogenase family protein [Amycolatopsis sp. H20-H5]|uniref:acyl-CoA dehydrogenase family protein n=1 Tax=Amycolatopsis sp. H20-H5 TaxID=3046309 RepID=UPI002DB96EAA|nr:acyl-CoA dehydrogenase family protein [Amycolatopsis sp. H20-H5]MEC3975178.1 acyl-CoA dehydrogenase family protein [Amycolatopsis sp. H20-H5]
MTTTEAPTGTELVRRLAERTDLFRKHALWQEENRRIHDESIEALADAGVFKLRTPARYGGYESDARTLVDVGAELGRADGALGWTASVYWVPTWMAGLFPDEAQDEVFATPDARVCGTLSPSAMAAPVDGGMVVNGRWGFISGAHHAHWQEIITLSPTPDGGMQPLMALVPMSEVQIVDDWHTAGLRGSGSVTTVAKDLFVPQHRILPLGAVLQGQSASVLNAESLMYRTPLLAAANAATVGPLIGLAKAAVEAFLERLPNRKITYTAYESQLDAPITHLQVGEAALKADQAEFHGHRIAELVDRKAPANEPWTLEERARTRADVGAASQLAKEAVGILAAASGGSSAYEDVPIQRIQRDVQVTGLHALITTSTNLELYGRILCGLEPNTPFI